LSLKVTASQAAFRAERAERRLFAIGDAPRDRLNDAQSRLFCGPLNKLMDPIVSATLSLSSTENTVWVMC
jgi:hypothetical protein